MTTPFLTGTNDEYIKRHDRTKNKSNRSPSEEKHSTFRYIRPQVQAEDADEIEKKKKIDWESTREKIRGYTDPANSIIDEMHEQVRPGLKFWEYLALANNKVDRPRLHIPNTLVNCPGNQQISLWTGTYLYYIDDHTGRISHNIDANYAEFERILVNKMESTIKIPPSKSVLDEKERKIYEMESKKKEMSIKKTKNIFYAVRKRMNENDSYVVRYNIIV